MESMGRSVCSVESRGRSVCSVESIGSPVCSVERVGSAGGAGRVRKSWRRILLGRGRPKISLPPPCIRPSVGV